MEDDFDDDDNGMGWLWFCCSSQPPAAAHLSAALPAPRVFPLVSRKANLDLALPQLQLRVSFLRRPHVIGKVSIRIPHLGATD